MPASMTGFGSGQVEFEGRRVTVEIRSVNHRYLDVRWHVFGELAVDRGRLERRLGARVHRGRVDVRVVLETDGGSSELVEVDHQTAEDLVASGRELADRLGLEPIRSVEQILSVPGVVRRRALTLDAPHLRKLEEAFDAAVRELVEMRRSEGAATASELNQRVDEVVRLVSDLDARSRLGVQERVDKMKARLHALMEGHPVDDGRVVQEAAMLADRLDVTEELERVSSHADQLRNLLRREEPVGRRIDFLLQELNREVNTIGSKSTEVEIAHTVIELKAELEKMREQSQNIE